MSDEDFPQPRRGRPLRLLAAALLLVAVTLVVVRAFDALLANDPALPWLLAATSGLALVLLIGGLRRRPPPAPGVLRLGLRIAATAAAAGFAAFLVWLTPLVATDAALTALGSDARVTVSDTRSATRYEPADSAAEVGLVVYPGALVDPRAYAVLARGIAERGYPVVVVKCPLGVALLCRNDAAALVDPTGWAIGGHSLGGVEAAREAGEYRGLLMWAAYPAEEVADVAATSVSGTADLLTTPDEIEGNAELMPPGTRFVAIDGAVHSHFGDYGDQPGDGEPTIDRETAQGRIIDASVDLLRSLTADVTE